MPSFTILILTFLRAPNGEEVLSGFIYMVAEFERAYRG